MLFTIVNMVFTIVVLWRYFPNIISVSQENAQPLSFQSLTKFLLIVLDYSRKQSFCCRGRGCVQLGYTFSFLLFLMSVSCLLLNGDRALHCKEYPWYIASRNMFYHFLPLSSYFFSFQHDSCPICRRNLNGQTVKADGRQQMLHVLSGLALSVNQ